MKHIHDNILIEQINFYMKANKTGVLFSLLCVGIKYYILLLA